jgi:hypothetical protein
MAPLMTGLQLISSKRAFAKATLESERLTDFLMPILHFLCLVICPPLRALFWHTAAGATA